MLHTDLSGTSASKNHLTPASVTGESFAYQGKLDVGSLTDPLEAEADAMADRVLRMSETAFVQRKCSSCEEDDKRVQRRPLASEITPYIQRRSSKIDSPISVEMSSRIESASGTGASLSEPTRSFMENRFGSQFSDVRIHADHDSAQLSHSLNAQAFTVGKDIYFNEGKYAPDSESGRHLLAHELTHTLQQSGDIGRIIQRRWDPAGENCPDVPAGKRLQKVVVDQEIPQSVTLYWNDGTTESDICSTGKGQCCTETSGEVACDVSTSRNTGTNCTPITSGAGYSISDRYLNYNGWEFWNTFVSSRGVALHQHHTVTGEPLSHGCVRLTRDTARRIFCGARQNSTLVQVKGFARPSCNSSQLQKEWLSDKAYAQTPTDGETASFVAGVRETRASLRRAFQVSNNAALDTLLAGLNSTNIAASIPRCHSVAAVSIPANSTTEEARVFQASSDVNQFLLVFAGKITAFVNALQSAVDFASAQTIANDSGRSLWQDALNRAQATTGANIDDRPLYWTRLRMIEEIRRFHSRFVLSTILRQQLIDAFERSSRGHTTIDFSGAATGQKKVLISGFDPFGFDQTFNGSGTDRTILDSNPSGAAVLALDGKTVSGNGCLSAFVQGVIFPVRYRDFDQGVIENLFGPFLNGTTPVSMIMTVSQGGSAFHIEQSAGRRRSTDSLADNEGRYSGGSASHPVEPLGLASGSEFLNTLLPHTEMSTVPQTTLRNTGATSTTDAAGNSVAVRGTGGGFLSNEIFYRVRLLQTSIGGSMATLPVGHLHVPNEDEMTRDVIKERVREIIAAALPALP